MFILLFYSFVNFHLIHTITHCGPETHFDAPLVDKMFSFTNPSAEELSYLNENSRESCLEQCCNTDKCNIASFNQSLAAVTGDNCFLYKCLPLENCQFQDSGSIISYVLKRDEDEKSTIQNEIDTTDPPPKDQEFIGEKVLEVINDTDVDSDLLKQDLNAKNTNLPLSSPSSLSTNTNNLTTKGTTFVSLARNSTTSKKTNSSPSTSTKTSSSLSTSTKTNSSPSTSTNTNSSPSTLTNTNSSPSSNKPSTTSNTSKTNSPVSLTSSGSLTTKNISSTIEVAQTNGSSTETNQMVLPTNQHPTKTSLKPSIVVSNEQGNNESSVAHPPTTVNSTTKTITETVLPNATKLTSQSTIANLTDLETTLNHAMTEQHNVTSPQKITTTSTILKTLTKASNLTNTVNKTGKATTSTTTPTTTTTTSLMTTEVTTRETTENLSTVETTTTKDITTSDNDTQPIVTNQSTTDTTNMSESTVKPITAGDMNITFADTNQMKEEKEESNVLSAALIAALSFGILFFFAVLVLIGKRCFDSWQKRHYSRIDYLVNGMYN